MRTPFVDDPDFTLYCGDALSVLRELPSESVHMCVTSPPYWGLRDYGVPGQLGLEATPEEYVARMVEVFREVRRVLRSDGTLWLNIGDSYASSPPGNVEGVGATSGLHGANDAGGKYRETLKAGHATKRSTIVGALKPKDLVGIPWRLAFALQADGWYLRSDIIWSKPNPMPESVTDRPTKSHEYVFLLAKQPRYYFDQEAVRERYVDPREGGEGFRWNSERYTNQTPAQSNHTPTLAGRERGQKGAVTRSADGSVAELCPGSPSSQGIEPLPSRPASAGRGPDGRRKTSVKGGDGSTQHRDGERWPHPTGRNVRSVWEIATQPYPEAHFATYPEELVHRCILAGTSERGCCPECGKPWERETETSYGPPRTGGMTSAQKRGDGHRDPASRTDTPRVKLSKATKTLGWRSTCDCLSVDFPLFGKPFHPAPCVVLDPFLGSGTTALVARKHGRRTIGIELSPDYCKLAARRLSQLSLLAGDAA